MASVKKMACLALTYMLIALAITVKATINCNQVLSTLEPCLSYVQGDVSTPPSGCCNGVSAVFSNAKTTPDRQDTCQCLKDTANEFPAMFKPDRVASLPKDCHLNLPFVISTSTNCKSYASSRHSLNEEAQKIKTSIQTLQKIIYEVFPFLSLSWIFCLETCL